MSFFEHTDYREALKELVIERKRLNPKFGIHSLADAARIQRPYMSKVLSGHADLSADQLYLIGESLKIDAERMAFLELLLNYARSAVASRKRELKAKIDEIVSQKRRVQEQLHTKVVTSKSIDALSSYYLTPWTQIVHIALFIPRYSKDITLLRSLLNISADQMQSILDDLRRMNLLSYANGVWQAHDGNLHLSRTSPLFHAWKMQAQLAGLQRQSSLNESNSTSVTFVFAATEETRKSIQKKFLSFLKEFEAEVTASESRNVYQLSFDLFPWL